MSRPSTTAPLKLGIVLLATAALVLPAGSKARATTCTDGCASRQQACIAACPPGETFEECTIPCDRTAVVCYADCQKAGD